MDYYSNARGGSKRGERPSDTAQLTYGWPVMWEEPQRCETYRSGVSFCSNI